MNYLIIDSLQKFYNYYGSDYELEYPTNSGKTVNIKEAAENISKRLINLFLEKEDGNIPMYGEYQKLQKELDFRKNYLFFEYFDGDTGKGLGASHQTGWTGLIAELIYKIHGIHEKS
jgi:hypothetical protein